MEASGPKSWSSGEMGTSVLSVMSLIVESEAASVDVGEAGPELPNLVSPRGHLG